MGRSQRAAALDAVYDPGLCGREAEPKGPLDEARRRSQQRQAAHGVIRGGSNKTLFDLSGARLRHDTLLLSNVENVIIRNMTSEDSWDHFPQWDAIDGS